jgi:uncharacterized 2Fe-2S/4Fe-4S cluster protein (DUF4445 family)
MSENSSVQTLSNDSIPPLSDVERARIVFTPSGLDGEFGPETTLLDAARALGADLDSVCGGRGICGRCMVVPSVGSFSKWAITSNADQFGTLTSLEARYNERKGLAAGERLACQLHAVGDAVIDIPPSSQVHRAVVRKSVELGDLVIDPLVTLLYVQIDPASLSDDRSAADRLIDALRQQHGLFVGTGDPTIDIAAATRLHKAVSGDEGTTVAIRFADTTSTANTSSAAARIVAVWRGYTERVVGIAIDIGSTTVAGHLCDLRTGEVLSSSGLMNPQIRFGEDLMSRVSYVMMNPGGDIALTAAIRESLAALVATLLTEADLQADALLDLVLVGNPIMHHIVLGIDPTPLGGAPFELAVSAAVHGAARDLGINAPFAELYVGPCIAGHVGADTAAAILSEGPHRSSSVQLLVDVGTNAEIVLGNNERLFAASSPTGPAFEGAQISCGVRATAGAIERVRIDRETLEPCFRAIGATSWSNEPGFAEELAATPISGVCGSGIIEAIGELYLSGILRVDGTFDPAMVERTPRLVLDGRTYAYVLYDPLVEGFANVEGPAKRESGAERSNGSGGPSGAVLRITQGDIRAIQLAKAALRAGIDLLMNHSGFTEVDDVRLAGAFGSHIDPIYALVLGLVPDCRVEAVRSSGNSAGSGAVRALLSAAARTEMETVVAGVTKIETALEPAFQELFVGAMGFPHTFAPSPHLGAAITLPVRGAHDANAGKRRRVRPAAEASL